MRTRRFPRGNQPAAAGPGKGPMQLQGIPVLTLSATFSGASDSLKIKQVEEQVLQNLEIAALLHDIGKVGIPDAILRKPGKLEAEEYALMKKHPEYGWAVRRMLPGFERAALDILHHHESFDGKGYPAGLKETEVPIVSRIVSVIDAFDAMLSW